MADDIIDSLEQIMFEAIGMTAVALAAGPVEELTFSQWRVLVILGRTDAMRVSDLATSIGTSLSSASRLIRRLERRAVVTTERDETDRRATLVRITARGHMLRDAVVSRRREIMEAALGQVAATLPRDLGPGLTAIAGAFDRYR